jgi:predicted Zn-dependent protease
MLSKRLTQHPDDRKTRLLAAKSARRGGEYVRAFDHLQKYHEKGGADEASALEAALLRTQMGDTAEADRLFAEYARKPDSPDTPFVMEAYLEGKLRVLTPKSGGRLNPEAEDVTLSALELNSPNLSRAVDLWLAARPSRADQAQGRLWRASMLLAVNKHSEGVVALQEAVELDPDRFETRYQLALAVSSISPEEARRQLEVLLAAHPENRDLRYGLAGVYRLLGRSKDARRLLEGLLDGPNDISVLIELAQLDLDEGNGAAAEPRLRAALERAPNSPSVNIALSRCLHLLGKPDEATKYRKRFNELEAEYKKPHSPAVTPP